MTDARIDWSDIDSRKLHVTPKGRAFFPALKTPDTKFQKDGEFHCRLVMGAAESADFRMWLQQQANEAFEVAHRQLKGAAQKKVKVQLPFKPEEDRETGEETGNYVFNFKQRATATRKDGSIIRFSVDVVDAHGRKLHANDVPDIGNGSILKTSFRLSPFYVPAQNVAGVSLRLAGVQIIELKQGSYDNTSVFGDEGGGWSATNDKSVNEGAADDDDVDF